MRLLTLFVLVACNNITPKVSDYHEFQTYVKEFEAVTQIKAEGSITFGETRERIQGICYPALTNWKVKINIDHWVEMSSLEKKSLIFHELGHCVCFLKHDNEKDEFGCEKKLMSSMATSHSCTELHWENYQKEIKEKCQNSFLVKILRKKLSQ